VELKEQELSHEDVVKNLKKGHDEHVTRLRQDFERQVKGECRVRKYPDQHENQTNLHINIFELI